MGNISMRIVHFIMQAGVFNIKGQHCFQLDLLALWFLPSGVFIPVAWSPP